MTDKPQTPDEKLQQEFNRWAEAGEGPKMEQHHLNITEKTIRLMDLRPGERILDLGCGDGQLTAHIAAGGIDIRGMDASGTMVAAARSRGIAADQADAEKLPYAHAEFDAVFSNAALHWVRGQDAMLAEVHRVLKPGGRFVAEMGAMATLPPFASAS